VHDPDGGFFKDQPEPLFALPQGLSRRLTFGDVFDYLDKSGYAAIGAALRKANFG